MQIGGDGSALRQSLLQDPDNLPVDVGSKSSGSEQGKSALMRFYGVDKELTSPQEARQEGERELPEAPPLKTREGKVMTFLRKAATTAAILPAAIDLIAFAPLRLLGAAAKAIYHFATRQTPPDTIKLNVDGQSVDINSKILGRVPKGVDINVLRSDIQAKIDNGERLVKGLVADDGSVRGPATTKQLADIMWYMQVKSEGKIGASFSEGAFTIPDPGNRIRGFLDSNPEAYQRLSSHLSDFQKAEHGQHRGTDASGDARHTDNLLPHGHKTVLYGSLDQRDSSDAQHERLYLKMEPHGAWLSTPGSGRDLGGPGRGMKPFHDWNQFTSHVATTVQSVALQILGKNSPPGTHKERIPPPMKNAFNAMVQNAPNEVVKNLLRDNNPTGSSSGLRVMKENLENALDHLGVDDPEDLPAGFKEAVKAFVDGFIDNDAYDHPELRFGEEIVFVASDLR